MPLYKNRGSKFDASNNRPSSLISVFRKIVETIITQIIEHCIGNKILIDELHGYVTKHSMITNLLEFINDILII